MIVLLGGQKGGSGKSTIATNLASFLANEGNDVVLVDANSEQGTSANWAQRREDTNYKKVTCIEKSGNLQQTLYDLSKKYEEVIVDTGGQDSRELRTGMSASNIIITPVVPAQTDVETLSFVQEVVSEAKDRNSNLESYFLITKAPTTYKSRKVSQTIKVIKSLDGFKLIDSITYNRIIYDDAMTAGAGVCELNDKKATSEITELVKEIYYA
jgi:chromosome partitioning protein